MISTPSAEATTTTELRPRNNPFSTTPTVMLIACSSCRRLRYRAERAIEDEIAAIGHECAALDLPQLRPGTKFFERAAVACQPNWTISTGIGKAFAEAVHELFVIDHHDKTIACRRDNLLAQQRPAMPLDQVERAALDLVGAVDRQIDAAVLAKCRQAGCRACAPSRRYVRRSGSRRRTSPWATRRASDSIDERGRRAGAEAEHHAAFDEFDGALGGGALQPVARVRIGHSGFSNTGRRGMADRGDRRGVIGRIEYGRAGDDRSRRPPR